MQLIIWLYSSTTLQHYNDAIFKLTVVHYIISRMDGRVLSESSMTNVYEVTKSEYVNLGLEILCDYIFQLFVTIELAVVWCRRSSNMCYGKGSFLVDRNNHIFSLVFVLVSWVMWIRNQSLCFDLFGRNVDKKGLYIYIYSSFLLKRVKSWWWGLLSHLYHQTQYSTIWDSKCPALIAQ